MCGRYRFNNGTDEQLNNFLKSIQKEMSETLYREISGSEIFPGAHAICCYADTDVFRTGIMKWGFPFKGHTIINARKETCFTSLFFKDCRPCVLPCTGYYEWDPFRTKNLISAGNGIQYLAGLFRMEKEPCFVIVTEDAAENIRAIHDRQPVLFTKETAVRWCHNPFSVLSSSLDNRRAVPVTESDSK